MPIIQELRRTTNIPIVGVTVDKSKYTRAEAVTPLFEGGKCFLPEKAAWLDEWNRGACFVPRASTMIWLIRHPVRSRALARIDLNVGSLAQLEAVKALVPGGTRLLPPWAQVC